MSAVLVIVDVQNAIDDPLYGKRGQPETENNIAKLLAHWRAQNYPVLHIRHDSTDPNSPYHPGQSGNDFKSQTAPTTGEVIVSKQTNNAFIATDLMEALEQFGTHELIITGVLLENSVDATARMASNLGFMVFMPADCVASVERMDYSGQKRSADEVHALSLAILDNEYVKVIPSFEEIIKRDEE